MKYRIDNLRQKMTEKKLDGFLVSNDINRRYLSGFTGTAGYLFITKDESVLATDFRYIDQASIQAPGFGVYRISGDYASWLPDLIARYSCRRIGFESNDLSLTSYRHLVRVIRKIRVKSRPALISTHDVIESIRAVKDTEEIEAITRAALLADKTENHAANFIQAGMTEKQVAWELEKFLKEQGSESLPFEIIVASGPNSALPHAQPSERVINSGDPVVIDLGARVNGYTSDITRTICFGGPDAQFRKVYEVVRKAQQTAIEHMRSEMTGESADRLARDIIESAGYGDAFGHGLGHGVGLQTHELPRLGPGSKDRLKEGMVFTVEPGIYLSGWGGVRIEDMILLEPTGPRVLTFSNK